jgi:hypothetical protein
MEVDICRKELQQVQLPRSKLGLAVHQLLIHPIQPVKNVNIDQLGQLIQKVNNAHKFFFDK